MASPPPAQARAASPSQWPRCAPPLARGRTLPANRLAPLVSVAVSADWDCGPRAVDAPRQRHHAQHQRLHSTTAAPCTWSAPWQASASASASAPAPCTWSARPRARCCKGEIPVQFHLPELNSPMRTGEKVGFVPPFVPPLGPGYPPFCPTRSSTPATAAQQKGHVSSVTFAAHQQGSAPARARAAQADALSFEAHPGPRTLVCEPDKGVTFTFVGSFVGTFWIFRASS